MALDQYRKKVWSRPRQNGLDLLRPGSTKKDRIHIGIVNPYQLGLDPIWINKKTDPVKKKMPSYFVQNMQTSFSSNYLFYK
jgi:hypothetical protein